MERAAPLLPPVPALLPLSLWSILLLSPATWAESGGEGGGPCLTTGHTTDCRSRHLTTVRPEWLPVTTRTLLLDHNPLVVLTNGSFGHLSELRVLHAESCQLTEMQTNSLEGLTNLEELHLDKNNVHVFNNEVARGVFAHTPNLRLLSVKGNPCPNPLSPNTTNSFSDLSRLQTLLLDSCSTLFFGPEFSSLKSLLSLSIYGHRLTQVNNASFIAFRNVSISELIMIGSGTFLTRFDSGVFEPVSGLLSLRLLGIRTGNKRALSSLGAFSNTTMDLLEMNGILLSSFENPEKRLSDGYISKEDAAPLQALCVKTFIFINNNVLAFEPECISHGSRFMTCLQNISFAGNPLGVGGQSRSSAYYLANSYRRLQQFTYDSSNHDEQFVEDYVTASRQETAGLLSDKPATHDDVQTMSLPSSLQFYVSPSLHRLYLFNVIMRGPIRGNFTIKNSVTEIFFVNTQYIRMEGQVAGLEGVRLLDLTGSGVFWEVGDLMDMFPGLHVLRLNNFRGSTGSSARWTAGLPSLVLLEVGGNSLDYFPRDMFASNLRLRRLRLHNNRFTSVPIDLDTVPSLRSLDLANNSILTLANDATQQLDARVTTDVEFALSLSGNKFLCGCAQFNFLVWLKTTKVQLDQRNYTCISQSGQLTSTAQLDPEAVWRACVGTLAFWISLVLFCLMTIGFQMVYMWAKLKTVIQALVFNLFVPGFRLKSRQDYKHDVFLGYADDDIRFVRHVLLPLIEDEFGLVRTWVHQRDLQSGFLDEQLVGAIQDSWRVLLVVSSNFLFRYDRAHIVMKMSAGCVSAENPRRVLALVHEPLGPRLPLDLASVLPEGHVMHVQSWHLPLTHAQKVRLRQALVL